MARPPRILTFTPNPALDLSTSTDRVEPVRKLRCAAPRLDPGGGGINVARVLHRLGQAVQAIYPAGGPTGSRLTGLLAREGLDSLTIQIAGETRQSFTVIDRSDRAEYRFVLPGPVLSAVEWQACLDLAFSGSAAGDVLVVSGSLPPGIEPDAMAALAGRARKAGLRLALDSSGLALAAALAAGVWLVKPSLRELSELLDRPLETRESRLQACRDLIAAGSAEMVALSLGEAGAVLVTAGEALEARGLTIEAVSTVGAGDSFLAGLLYGLTDDRTPAEALRLAIAAGAGALLAPGTSLSRAEDVRRLAPRVEVTAL